jgi:flagellar hook protein FlgE
MTLQTALSGLLGAQTGLNTVSNDLANANTTAFKSQTALFEDIYPANSNNVPGIGTATEGISTDQTQGNLNPTGNPLDAAIQGDGYFIISNNGTQQYSRDGAFQLSKAGTLETLNGAAVQGYTQDQTTGTLGSTLGALTINTGSVAANPTSALGLTLNLNSGDAVTPLGTSFSETDSTTYQESTSVVTYDSLGNANRVQLYFQQEPSTATPPTPSWNVYTQPQLADGTAVGSATLLTNLTFTSAGALSSGSPATLPITWGNGAADSSVVFNFDGTTFGAQNFAVSGVTNDGYAPGNYSSTQINANGDIVSTYTNGKTVTSGAIAIANFINPQGLEPITGNLYATTTTSGAPVVNTPGNGQAGSLSGGNLEVSNASTSALLVSLIQYQQAYQANTSVLQTEQQDSQRLVQI